ncbi:transposase [Spirillospora sp. NPDC048824]|uniref:transposase n=1 Tax=Spirillospora sp. NPDC048824 TaxID=3364526 RepID=UPI0037120101
MPGDATPGRMQHLLNAAKWDIMGAMTAVRTLVCERLDDGDAVAILDESGQEEKGTCTVGVKRQYVGCADRVSNAINVVYCSFATAAGHALVGARPYLPREQAADPDRRERDRVPEHVVFATPWIFWAPNWRWPGGSSRMMFSVFRRLFAASTFSIVRTGRSASRPITCSATAEQVIGNVHLWGWTGRGPATGRGDRARSRRG